MFIWLLSQFFFFKLVNRKSALVISRFKRHIWQPSSSSGRWRPAPSDGAIRHADRKGEAKGPLPLHRVAQIPSVHGLQAQQVSYLPCHVIIFERELGMISPYVPSWYIFQLTISLSGAVPLRTAVQEPQEPSSVASPTVCSRSCCSTWTAQPSTWSYWSPLLISPGEAPSRLRLRMSNSSRRSCSRWWRNTSGKNAIIGEITKHSKQGIVTLIYSSLFVTPLFISSL